MERETIVYNGKNYHRYPESDRPQHRNYFYRHDKNKESPVPLHRQIWEDVNGPIPEGMEIHHRDHNPLNNAITNLECLSASGHRKEHPMSEQGRASNSEKAKKNNHLGKWREENPKEATRVYAENARKTKNLETWKKENPELSKKVYSEAGRKGGSVGAGSKTLNDWRKNNPEAARDAARENGHRSKEALQTWVKNNPEKGKETLQEWKKNNPDLAREIYREAGRKGAEARRAKKAACL